MNRKLEVLKNKIKANIEWHKLEMKKKDDNFNCAEGRKIEAEIILDWIKKYEIDVNVLTDETGGKNDK